MVPSNDAAPEPTATELEPSRVGNLIARQNTKLANWIENEFGGGPPHPEDVVQKTFEKLSSHRALSEVQNLEAYAWTPAINVVRKEKRAQMVAESYANDYRNGVWGNELDEFDPERILRAKEQLNIVAQTLQGMSDRRRAIFMACRFEGLSHEAAGKRVGVSRTSALRHVSVATEMILEALADQKGCTKNSTAR